MKINLVELIIYLLKNPEELKQKGENAKRVHEKYFKKEKIIEEYINIVKEL